MFEIGKLGCLEVVVGSWVVSVGKEIGYPVTDSTTRRVRDIMSLLVHFRVFAGLRLYEET
jgi:hypothetical protein